MTNVARRRCAFLTMEETQGWSIDADLAFEPLAALGWQCEWLPWRRRNVDWDSWDAVYVAATWDYPEDPTGFLAVLESIDRSAATLVNPLPLIRWNIPKTYLQELATGGAAIVPSHWYERFADCDLAADAQEFGIDRLVVKPVVSTNATDTYLLSPPGPEDELAATFADRPFVVQPFIHEIRTDGEFSLFYIGGRFSHAIRKVPESGDFRVQEEHGADIRPAEPPPGMIAAADDIHRQLSPAPLYARCDFVRDGEGAFRVMELELIEPSLYLRMDENAPGRFAKAFDDYVRALREPGS